MEAGLVPALAQRVQVPGSSSWLRVSITPTDRPLTELSARLAELSGRDPAVVRKGLADAPGSAQVLMTPSRSTPSRSARTAVRWPPQAATEPPGLGM
jgi:hypothetical protein